MQEARAVTELTSFTIYLWGSKTKTVEEPIDNKGKEQIEEFYRSITRDGKQPSKSSNRYGQATEVWVKGSPFVEKLLKTGYQVLSLAVDKYTISTFEHLCLMHRSPLFPVTVPFVSKKSIPLAMESNEGTAQKISSGEIRSHLLTFLFVKAASHAKELAKIADITRNHRRILEFFGTLKALVSKTLHLKLLAAYLLGGHLLTYLSIKAVFHIKEAAIIVGTTKVHRRILEPFGILEAE